MSYNPYKTTIAATFSPGGSPLLVPNPVTINTGWIPAYHALSADLPQPVFDDLVSFDPRDGFVIERFGLFCNFADGLIIDGAISGYLAGRFTIKNGVPAAGDGQIMNIVALNTWVETNDYLLPQIVGVDRPIAFIDLNGQLDTTLIDPALNGKIISMQLVVQLAHSYQAMEYSP